MTQNFTQFLALVVDEATKFSERKARQLAPKHLQSVIKSTHSKRADTVHVISMVAEAPDAAAQEFGSGLRATRGAKAKYIIAPKTKKYLAFPWDVSHPFPVYQGKAVINRFWQPEEARNRTVKHPGIPPYRGRGYLNPAADETIDLLKRELRTKASVSIKKDIIVSVKTA